MNVQIGSETDPRGSKMAAYAQVRGVGSPTSMRASVGQEAQPQRDPRDAQKKNMLLAARVGQQQMPSGDGCEQPIDPRVMAAVFAGQNGNMTQPPPGVAVDPALWAAMVALVNATKYCPSPARVGWQCDSLTFSTLALAAGGTATVTVTPTRAFCMSALVGAAGTSNDPNYTIDSLTYGGTNYVTNGPWYGPYYKGDAACCLCVRELPIIDPNTPVAMVIHSQVAGGGAAINVFVEIFGETLFCGSP